MIEIIQYPTKTDWRTIRVSCQFCDCTIEATLNEFKKAYDRYNNLYYEITCPFCGRDILASPSDGAEIWVSGPATRAGYDKRKVQGD